MILLVIYSINQKCCWGKFRLLGIEEAHRLHLPAWNTTISYKAAQLHAYMGWKVSCKIFVSAQMNRSGYKSENFLPSHWTGEMFILTRLHRFRCYSKLGSRVWFSCSCWKLLSFCINFTDYLWKFSATNRFITMCFGCCKFKLRENVIYVRKWRNKLSANIWSFPSCLPRSTCESKFVRLWDARTFWNMTENLMSLHEWWRPFRICFIVGSLCGVEALCRPFSDESLLWNEIAGNNLCLQEANENKQNSSQ